MLAGPTTTRSAGQLDPDRRQGLAVAAQAAPEHAFRFGQRRRRRLDADHQELAVAEPDQVLGRCSSTAHVVDVDRRVLRLRIRVDEHDRQAGPPDLLDLGMVVGEADRDDAIDGRAADRPRQRAVERRDEREPVAGLLGDDRDAFREGTEERVREDHRQGLRREHPDRQGLPLREHARDRVRAVAERLGYLADALGGLRRQPVRAVEREGHRRLRDPCLACDVGNPRPLGVLLHSGPGSSSDRGNRLPEPVEFRSRENRFSKPV